MVIAWNRHIHNEAVARWWVFHGAGPCMFPRQLTVAYGPPAFPSGIGDPAGYHHFGSGTSL
ncbi:hypothetical protein [Methanoregula sp.]|uniref:hypothetical protein n=1 Tax=Methanoregula sp. TaxID=2052170 RepID=UPI0025E36067|nr:hypothetical protein [Methanoregula sp.]